MPLPLLTRSLYELSLAAVGEGDGDSSESDAEAPQSGLDEPLSLAMLKCFCRPPRSVFSVLRA